MRLIDADALKPLLREYCVDDDEVVMKWYDIMGVDEVVDRAPTIDAVTVVRCKECKHCNTDLAMGKWYGSCKKWNTHSVMADWYCVNGERKDNEID